jgi:hypothetical protein
MRARFIQCVSPFKGGTKMNYGGTKYHFLPNELGDFVAEVSDDQHYSAILSIGAAFRPYASAESDEAAAAVEARIAADTALRVAAAAKPDRMAAARAARSAKRTVAAE